MFHAINILSGEGGGLSGQCGPAIQECWEFEHPRRDHVLNSLGLPPTNSHNVRSTKLIFHIPHAGVLHGLAGYFESVLYGSVGLSIHPERMDKISKDMLSWFPLFFPLKEPMYLPSNSELHVSMWRLTNERQVWYEWYAEAFLPLPESALVARGERKPSMSMVRAGSVSSFSTPSMPPSSLADAEDRFVTNADYFASQERALQDEPAVASNQIGLVKIGQTSLHNPKGRSSWIGL